MKNILFLGLNALWATPMANDIELIKKHLALGNKVHLLKCDKSNCPMYFNINSENCYQCDKKFEDNMKMARLINKISIVHYDLSVYHDDIPNNIEFNNIQDLKEVTIKDYDIGMAIASLIISNLRDPNPQIDERLKRSIYLYITNLYKFITYLEDTVLKLNIKRVYVFNGRFPHYRMALRICQKKGIEVFVHERGSKLNNYRLTQGTYSHDIDNTKKLIEKIWRIEENYKLKEQEALKWYNDRKSGQNKGVQSYIGLQNVNNLPLIDKKKKNIGIFISSEDEVEAVAGWQNRIYKNQNDALKKIIECSEWDDDVYFYLRVNAGPERPTADRLA